MHTIHQQLWGSASFGKRDGFELLTIDGALKEFETRKQIETLSQALQLRLEDVRIFPDTEILGTTRLTQGDVHWQFFMLYRYTLDIYKRDGFYAGALGLKDAKADPQDVLFFLRRLTDQTKQRIRQEPLTVEIPQIKVDALPLVSNGIERRKRGFIPFSTNDLSEQLAFIKATMNGELPQYHRLLGSQSRSVISSVDEYKYVRFRHHPFYEGETLEVEELPLTNETEKGTPEQRPALVKESLVFAFEQAEENPWQKSKKRSFPEQQRKEKDSFLAGLFRMLGVKK